MSGINWNPSAEHDVLIATDSLKLPTADGGMETRAPGEPVPEAHGWRRLLNDLQRGRVLRLSGDACLAIVRSALKQDPSLKASPNGEANDEALSEVLVLKGVVKELTAKVEALSVVPEPQDDPFARPVAKRGRRK